MDDIDSVILTAAFLIVIGIIYLLVREPQSDDDGDDE